LIQWKPWPKEVVAQVQRLFFAKKPLSFLHLPDSLTFLRTVHIHIIHYNSLFRKPAGKLASCYLRGEG
jgi:hypothetical protein